MAVQTPPPMKVEVMMQNLLFRMRGKEGMLARAVKARVLPGCRQDRSEVMIGGRLFAGRAEAMQEGLMRMWFVKVAQMI